MRYSFKGALPSYLQTITVPLFEDRTNWPGLREELTNEVINAFIQDNTLTVVENEEDADLVLNATITSITERSVAITPEEDVEETQVWVSVSVNCLNKHTNQPLWQGAVSHYGTVSGVGDLEEKDVAISSAVNDIVADIINKTIAAW